MRHSRYRRRDWRQTRSGSRGRSLLWAGAAEFTAFAACVIDCDSSFYFSHISRFIGLLGLFSFTDEGGKVAGFILQIYCQFSGNPIISPKKFRNVFLNIIFIQMSRYGRAVLSRRRAKAADYINGATLGIVAQIGGLRAPVRDGRLSGHVSPWGSTGPVTSKSAGFARPLPIIARRPQVASAVCRFWHGIVIYVNFA